MFGLVTHLASVAATAASAPVDNDVDSESAKSGPLGLVVIILLCVACYFLFKSLSKHLRSVREGTLGDGKPPVDQVGSVLLAVKDEPVAERPASESAQSAPSAPSAQPAQPAQPPV